MLRQPSAFTSCISHFRLAFFDGQIRRADTDSHYITPSAATPVIDAELPPKSHASQPESFSPRRQRLFIQGCIAPPAASYARLRRRHLIRHADYATIAPAE